MHLFALKFVILFSDLNSSTPLGITHSLQYGFLSAFNRKPVHCSPKERERETTHPDNYAKIATNRDLKVFSKRILLNLLFFQNYKGLIFQTFFFFSFKCELSSIASLYHYVPMYNNESDGALWLLKVWSPN